MGPKIAGCYRSEGERSCVVSRIKSHGNLLPPRLCGGVVISGAAYNMVGVKDPATLIAINSDPEALIFGSADLGIVGALPAVLP